MTSSCSSDPHHTCVQAWMSTYSVPAYRTACSNALRMPPRDTYTRRVQESNAAYHTRPFVHRVSPLRAIVQSDAPTFMRADDSTWPWRGRRAPYVPTHNLENGTAALEAMQRRPVDDRMRVMYIKTYKVGSTTVSSLVARWAITRGMQNNENGRRHGPGKKYPFDFL